MSEAQPQPQFSFEKVYVKDVSLEIPHAPKIFTEQVQPKLEVHIETVSDNFAEGYYEVTVTATVTAKVGERTLFLVEAAQAGLFSIRGVPDTELKPLLGIVCPREIFPYLRETISDLIARAGFPPVLLQPMNFETLYMQQLQTQAASG